MGSAAGCAGAAVASAGALPLVLAGSGVSAPPQATPISIEAATVRLAIREVFSLADISIVLLSGEYLWRRSVTATQDFSLP